MGLLDGILGLEDIKKRLDEIEMRLANVEGLTEKEYESTIKFKTRILKILVKPKTTEEIATKLKKSRSWTSYVLNKMEKEGLVKESGRKGKELLYAKV